MTTTTAPGFNMISTHYELGKLNKPLFWSVQFISFYLIIRLFTNIQSFISKYITGFWLEPAAVLVSFILAAYILPILFLVIYFKYIKGVKN